MDTFTSPVSHAITKSSLWGVLGTLAGPAYSSEEAVKFRSPASYTAAQWSSQTCCSDQGPSKLKQTREHLSHSVPITVQFPNGNEQLTWKLHLKNPTNFMHKVRKNNYIYDFWKQSYLFWFYIHIAPGMYNFKAETVLNLYLMLE